MDRGCQEEAERHLGRLDKLDREMITRKKNKSIETIRLNAYLLQKLNVQSKSWTEGQNNNKRYFQRSTMSAIFPLHTVGVQYGNADVDAIFDVV